MSKEWEKDIGTLNNNLQLLSQGQLEGRSQGAEFKRTIQEIQYGMQ